MQFIPFRSAGQMAMPDHVCAGQTRHYYVIPGPAPGSTYTWWLDGRVMSGFNTSELIYTWHSSKTYLLEVQERSADGCPGPKKSGEVFVNPQPEIQVSVSDSLICSGESVTVSIQKSCLIWGKWIYDLIVEPEAAITGNTITGTYSNPADLNETLFNNDTVVHKVIYRFTPRIIPDDGGSVCVGTEKTITMWVHPAIKFTRELSDYKGFNLSCYSKSDGSISIGPSASSAPYTFRWSGPSGFRDSTEDISRLSAGQYTLLIVDKNMCQTRDTFNLIQPERMSMTIETSVSRDGNFNIDCFGGQTGSVGLTAINNVGPVEYLWIDGYIGKVRPNMSAGPYKIILNDSNSCNADSTVTLTEPEPILISFEVTVPFCPLKPDGEIRVNANGGIPGTDYFYLWQDYSTGNVLENIPEGWYKVLVTDINGCTVADSVHIIGMNKICLNIPEAFSPNKDLINDFWNIENTDLYPQIEITIYNRWGQAVWKSDRGYPIPWDGRSRSEDLPVDSYHYAIDLNNGTRPVVGTITIIR